MFSQSHTKLNRQIIASYKINQMRKRLEETERISKETSAQLEDYVRKHAEMMNKYFNRLPRNLRIKP